MRQWPSPEGEVSPVETDPVDMFVWDPVIGPADTSGPTSPNPMSIIGPGTAMPSLATRLNWKLAGSRDRRPVPNPDPIGVRAT